MMDLDGGGFVPLIGRGRGRGGRGARGMQARLNQPFRGNNNNNDSSNKDMAGDGEEEDFETKQPNKKMKFDKDK